MAGYPRTVFPALAGGDYQTMMKKKTDARLRSEAQARAAALFDDLNAVRTVVLSKQRNPTPEELASLERRLFESWAIEQIARAQSQAVVLQEELEDMRAELDETRQAVKVGLKELARVAKLAQKKAGK